MDSAEEISSRQEALDSQELRTSRRISEGNKGVDGVAHPGDPICCCGVDFHARLPMVTNINWCYTRAFTNTNSGDLQVIKPLSFGLTIRPAHRQQRQANVLSK